MSKKKQRELQLIESLIKLAPLPGYHVVEQRESPDILIEGPKKELIGLEITEYEQQGGKPFKRYQVERFWEEIRWKLHDRRAALPKGDPLKEIEGIISFSNDRPPGKIYADKVASEIMDFASNHLADIPEKHYRTFIPSKETPLLTKFVKRIRLKKLKGIVSLLWEVSNISGGWFAISGKDLMSIINEKERKLDSYRKALPRFKQWLLIGAIGDSVWRMIYFKDIVGVCSTTSCYGNFSERL